MLRVRPLSIPSVLPHPDAIQSWDDNRHGYEPEFWEFQYNVYRYLSGVTENDLIERYQSLVRNMKDLVRPDRHVIPIQSFLSSWYWYRKEHQTRLEFTMRGTPLPIPMPDGPLDSTPVGVPAQLGFPNAGDVLFRYGELKYMNPMFDEGRIRISPASENLSPELVAARKDDERAKTSFMSGQYTQITTPDGKLHKSIGDLRRIVSTLDYYMLCLSCDWVPSLFPELPADACIVIREPQVFTQRLNLAAKEQLDKWNFHHRSVEYFDPYEMLKTHNFNAGMCKDFRFAYQQEYRFLWMPREGQEADDFKYLNLGPLNDIAELHIR